MSELPEMSRHEASWHEHLAGMRARSAARQQGGNPTAIQAFATATAGPVEIAGFKLQAATEGTVWALKRLAREFAAWADRLGMPSAGDGEENGTREMLELGLSTLAFCDARRVWQRLECGELEELIVDADALMWDMHVADLKLLERHFQKQMQAIRDLTPDAGGAPKKDQPAAGNGISPGTPIPPEAEASPASSGSPPNIGYPLKQPSGKPAL